MAQLEDLYREIILDHYKNPRNQGELPSPPAVRTEGHNPLCGDQITLTLLIDDNDTIADVKICGHGCSISQSSASMMTAAVTQKSISEVRELTSSLKAMLDIHEQLFDSNSAESGRQTDVSPANERKLGDLIALQGVVKFPVRIKCATLAWNTLLQAIDDHYRK